MKYDKAFKEEAIRLSDEIGLKQASAQLGVQYGTLADWRKTRSRHGEYAFVGSGHKQTAPMTPEQLRIQELEKELAETKRANEILKEALGFFAQSRKR